MVNAVENQSPHQVVIIGGGFGGLYSAKALSRVGVNVTLVETQLSSVSTTSTKSQRVPIPADISSPLRSVLNSSKNTKVLMAEVTDIDPEQRDSA